MKMEKVQFITHETVNISYAEGALMALLGGCRWIQLRMKDAEISEICNVARLIEPACHSVGAKFILDDHVELVKTLKADGVHLGKNDIPIKEARKILGNDCIIGGTANTIEDIVNIYNSGADYIGCGPFRFTSTKKNLSPIIGINGYYELIFKMRKQHIKIPIVAIGGITEEDIHPILKTGINGIALSGTIMNADNPVDKMKQIINNTYIFK
jgi:thiamine-phosphate pyrophosphorylase